MTLPLQAAYLTHGNRRIFTMFHPVAQARAAVLLLPPFLHEQTTSYRLFAQLGEELARHGVAVMRPHYYAAGDSDGEELEFSLEGARADGFAALAWLRERVPAAPVIALGVRAGALIAAALAGQAHLDGLWLWQPVVDGTVYLEEMRTLDKEERRQHGIASQAGGAGAAEAGQTLVGFPCSAMLLVELARARLLPSPAWPAASLALSEGPAAPPLLSMRTLQLAPELAAWARRVHLYRIAPASIKAVASELVASMDAA